MAKTSRFRQQTSTVGIGDKYVRGDIAFELGSVERPVSVKPDQVPLRLRIHDLSRTQMRYGYRIYIMLRREDWLVNHKRVHRLYRQDGLSLRLNKPRRNVSAADRIRQPAVEAPNEMWSMDFVSVVPVRRPVPAVLSVVDTYTLDALAIDVDQGIKGEQVVEAMADSRHAWVIQDHSCRQHPMWESVWRGGKADGAVSAPEVLPIALEKPQAPRCQIAFEVRTNNGRT